VGFIIGNILVISNLAFPKAKKEKEGERRRSSGGG